MASDSKGEVSGKWMHDHGAKYPYAHDRSKGLFTWVNAPGWPHAMLIDANGALAWSGGAESLSDDILQNAVKGAIAKPLWEWPASTKDAKTALLKHAYKAALDAAAKLSAADDGPAIKTAIEGIVNGKVEGMKAAYAKGDFLGAESAATAMQKEQDGLPGKAEAVKMLADLKANKDAAPVLVAQRKIAKFRGGDITKSKELEAAIDDLKKIAKDMANTYAATEATALAGDFQKRLKAKKGG